MRGRISATPSARIAANSGRPRPGIRKATADARPAHSTRDEEVRGRDAGDRDGESSGVHRSTSGVSCSSRAGPIPGTASSSSTDANAPFAVR